MSEYESDSDMPSRPAAGGFSANHNVGISTTNANPTTVMVCTADLVDLISKDAKKNYSYSRVTGLRYFCGDPEKHPDYPDKSSIQNAHQWVQDIDSLSTHNWTDQDRLEVAKEYSLGRARDYLLLAIQKHGCDWEAVKDQFLQIFPNKDNYDDLMKLFVEAHRVPGETLTEYYIRLDIIRNALTKEVPDMMTFLQNYSSGFSSKFSLRHYHL
ncbi:hypothetical protein E2C01_052136 [Portunus trituberculatus]|uniref:Retrotransposon gag domain-containing protein n=1 Tax=Portunus trituberculatus TaxID=210409 RepID=A0A5B7GDM5_PORTR|nr:hypothetical protein [Portunus trituberculatus]